MTKISLIGFVIGLPWLVKVALALLIDYFPIKGYRTKYYLWIDTIGLLFAYTGMIIFGLHLWSFIFFGFLINLFVSINDICVLPNSLILTKDGLKPINKIKIGDYVLTHTNRWQKVLNVYKTFVSKQVSVINNHLHITNNHPLYLFNYSNRQKIWSLESFVPFWNSIDNLDKKKHGCVNICNTETFHNITDIKFQKKPVMDLHSDGMKNEYLTITKEFLISIGLFLGDGTIPKNTNQLSFSLGITKKDNEAIKYLDRFAEQNGFKFTKDNNTNAVRKLLIIRKQLSDIYKQFYKNEKKYLPLQWINIPIEQLKYIIYGFYLADGHTISNRGKKYGFGICNTSLDLLISLKIRLESEGIFATLHKLRKKGKMIILGKLCNCQDYYVLEFRSVNCNKIFPDLKKPYYNSWRPAHFREIFHYIIKPFKIFKSYLYTGYVYNLEVEHDNSYIANGNIVHNCNDATLCVYERKFDLKGKGVCVQWISLAVVGLFTSLFGAKLAETMNYRLAYGICLIFPLLYVGYLKFLHFEQKYAKKPFSWGDIGKHFSNHSFVWGLVFIACLQLTPSFGLGLMAEMREHMGVSKMFVGLLGATGTVVGLIGYMLYFKFGSKFDLKSILFYSIIFSAITNMFYIYIPNQWYVLAYGIIFGAFSGVSFMAILTLMTNIIPKGNEGVMYAFVAGLSNLCAKGSGILSGIIYDNYGYRITVWISALLTLFCLVIIPKLKIKE